MIMGAGLLKNVQIHVEIQRLILFMYLNYFNTLNTMEISLMHSADLISYLWVLS